MRKPACWVRGLRARVLPQCLQCVIRGVTSPLGASISKGPYLRGMLVRPSESHRVWVVVSVSWWQEGGKDPSVTPCLPLGQPQPGLSGSWWWWEPTSFHWKLSSPTPGEKPYQQGWLWETHVQVRVGLGDSNPERGTIFQSWSPPILSCFSSASRNRPQGATWLLPPGW